MKHPGGLLHALALALGLAGGCAPTYADGYQDALASGLRAKHAGRSEEAIAAFAQAAGLADRYKDREHARMLLAETMEYAGHRDEALDVWRAISNDADGRYHGARAAFAVARIVLERDGLDAGMAETLAAIRTHKDSGLVRHAVRRLLALVEDASGPAAAYAWLEPLEAELRPSSSGEAVTFELHMLEARKGDRASAIAHLLELARAHPYPLGSLTDDAYMAASVLLEEEGDVARAIAVLEEMLAPQEAAYNGSSYDRPLWPPGAYRIATLKLDKLGDTDGALAGFWRLYERHRTSRQTDDALFDVARIEASRGRADEACDAMQTLRELNPESKFLRCGHYVCATEPKPSRPCSSSVLTKLGKDPDTEWAAHTGIEPSPLAQPAADDGDDAAKRD